MADATKRQEPDALFVDSSLAIHLDHHVPHAHLALDCLPVDCLHYPPGEEQEGKAKEEKNGLSTTRRHPHALRLQPGACVLAARNDRSERPVAAGRRHNGEAWPRLREVESLDCM